MKQQIVNQSSQGNNLMLKPWFRVCKPVADDEILALSKLKTFVDKNFSVVEMEQFSMKKFCKKIFFSESTGQWC